MGLQLDTPGTKLYQEQKILKRRRELLDKFELVHYKVEGALDHIFEKVELNSESVKSVWNNLPNETMIGVLHAFVLLRPTLLKSFKNCKRVEGAIEYMHQNGFDPKPEGIASGSIMPIITREQSLYF